MGLVYGVCAKTVQMLYSSYSSRLSILNWQQENKEIFSWYDCSIQIFQFSSWNIQISVYKPELTADRVFLTLEIKNGSGAKATKRQFIYNSTEYIY